MVHVYSVTVCAYIFLGGFSQDLESKMWSMSVPRFLRMYHGAEGRAHLTVEITDRPMTDIEKMIIRAFIRDYASRHMLTGLLLVGLGCGVSVAQHNPTLPDSTVQQATTPATTHSELPTTAYATAPDGEGSIGKNVWLKTNAAAWGLLVQNIAVEVSLSSRYSLSVPVYYSSLNYFRNDVKFRGFGLQPEVRYYPENLTNSSLQPYIGIHASFAYYNVALGGTYRYQDHNKRRPLGGGGLHIGLRLPFSHEGRDTRWGMEAQIGIGAAFMQTDKFENAPNGQRIDSHESTYFGIDNFAVSFYYAFRSPRKKHSSTAHE